MKRSVPSAVTKSPQVHGHHCPKIGVTTSQQAEVEPLSSPGLSPEHAQDCPSFHSSNVVNSLGTILVQYQEAAMGHSEDEEAHQSTFPFCKT